MIMVALMLCAAEARAAVRAAPSQTVEAIVATADAIVVGRIVKQQSVAGNNNRLTVLTIEVEQTLKGKAGRTINSVVWGDPDPARRSSSRRLIWLDSAGALLNGMQLSKGQQAALSGIVYGVREWYGANCRSIEQTEPNERAVYRLTDQGPDRPLLLRELAHEELVSAFAAEIAAPARANFGILELQVSPASEGFEIKAPIRPRYLLTPIDQRLVVPARWWIKSRDAFDRWNGATILKNYKSPEHLAAMNALLADPFTADDPWPHVADFRALTGSRKWAATPYPLRRIAFDTLKAWGVHVSEIELASPAYPARRVSNAQIVTPISCIAIIAIALFFVAWFWRGKFWAGVAGVSWLMLIVTIALYVRSKGTIDEIAWTGKDKVRWEAVLLNGRVRVMRIERFNEPTPMLWTSVRREEKTQMDWTPSNQWTTPMPGAFLHEVMGFVHAQDQMVGPEYAPRPYALWAAPIWPAIVVFALLPVARLCAAVVRKTRRAKGRCAKCGYDMRATPQRCPECGAVA
jgi:hypothetical protein